MRQEAAAVVRTHHRQQCVYLGQYMGCLLGVLVQASTNTKHNVLPLHNCSSHPPTTAHTLYIWHKRLALTSQSLSSCPYPVV